MPNQEEISAFIIRMPAIFRPEKAVGLNTVLQLNLTGDNGGKWWLKIADGKCNIEEGEASSPQMTLISSADDLYAVLSGEANAISSFMQGKIKVQGDMALALRMQSMFDFDAA
jgi:putative sterol carrier protein